MELKVGVQLIQFGCGEKGLGAVAVVSGDQHPERLVDLDTGAVEDELREAREALELLKHAVLLGNVEMTVNSVQDLVDNLGAAWARVAIHFKGGAV